jgi:hypothetical protein
MKCRLNMEIIHCYIIGEDSMNLLYMRCGVFLRNGMFPASASIDAHGHFIEKRNKGCSLQVSQATQELKASHRLRMT